MGRKSKVKTKVVLTKEQIEEIEKKAAEDYAKLTFTDDFLFYYILISNIDICKRMIEIILGKTIKQLKIVNEQKTIKLLGLGKGVRLDVYVEDEDGNVYNLEMQTTSSEDLGQRLRYYSSIITINCLRQGKKYKELKPEVIIFICTFDPFGYNDDMYVFDRTCRKHPELHLNDDCSIIILNTKGQIEEGHEELAGLLQYLDTGKPTTDFTSEIDEKVILARNNKEWEVEYMSLMIRDQENFQAGREEGREEGREIERNDTIKRLYRMVQDQTISVSAAAIIADVSEEHFLKVAQG